MNKIITIVLILITLISCKSKEDKIFDYISDKDYEGLKYHLGNKSNININFKNKEGKTPLFYAISQKDFQAVEILINNGARINEKFGDTISIFGLALISNEYKIIEFLAKRDTIINKPCYKKLLPLEYAVKSEKIDLIKLLIANNADPNITDSIGNTPIFYARKIEVFKALLQNGAKITLENKDGLNIIKNAQILGYSNICNYCNKKNTFALCDVKIAKQLIPETGYINSLSHIVKRKYMPIGGFPIGWMSEDEFKNNYNYKVLCYSDTCNLIKAEYHPLLASIEFAYYEHRPLIISPDMIWLLICQGVSQHIELNASKLQSKLVNFKEKKDIRIRRDFFAGSDKKEWKSIIKAVRKEIIKNTIDSLSIKMVVNFTTTTENEEIAYEITNLDIMKNYFNYIMFSCGIPEITLEGTSDDWERIYQNVDYFKKYELNWWIDSIKPVLKEFVNTSNGKINKDFWKGILKNNWQLACDENNKMTGWIIKFFPYTYEIGGEFGNHHLKIIQNPNLAKNGNTILTRENFLSGVSVVPFIWLDDDKKYDMNFVAGFVGIKQIHDTKALRPEIGWGILMK